MPLFRRPSRKPLWQDEFSVFTADERYVTRRQLTKFLTLTSLAMFVGNLWILVKSLFRKTVPLPVVTVARAGEIPVHGMRLFQYPTARDACVLVRTGPDTFVAYSQKCTHLSCAVYYTPGDNQFACPCHQGYFAIADGSVLQGPPRRPLPRVALEIRSGSLVAAGLEGEGA